jgi:cytochrome b5
MLPAVGRVTRSLSANEISQHSSPESAWVVIHNNVYDVTDFVSSHPGGAGILLRSAGGDVSADFDAIFHSGRAKRTMEGLKIGVIREQEWQSSPPMKPNNRTLVRRNSRGSFSSNGSSTSQQKMPSPHRSSSVSSSIDDRPAPNSRALERKALGSLTGKIQKATGPRSCLKGSRQREADANGTEAKHPTRGPRFALGRRETQESWEHVRPKRVLTARERLLERLVSSRPSPSPPPRRRRFGIAPPKRASDDPRRVQSVDAVANGSAPPDQEPARSGSALSVASEVVQTTSPNPASIGRTSSAFGGGFHGSPTLQRHSVEFNSTDSSDQRGGLRRMALNNSDESLLSHQSGSPREAAPRSNVGKRFDLRTDAARNRVAAAGKAASNKPAEVPFRGVVLSSRAYTRNTFILAIECLNMPTIGPCQHVDVRCALSDGSESTRRLTPIRYDNRAGLLWFVVKEYLEIPTQLPSALREKREGDAIELCGPIQAFDPLSLCGDEPQGSCPYDRLLCLAAGTGIAPVFTLIANFICDESGSKRANFEKTKIRVVTANRTPGDVLLHQELATFSASVDILHTVNVLGHGDPSKWPMVGSISIRDVKSFLGKSSRPFALVCGPPGFCNEMTESLEANWTPYFVLPFDDSTQ